MTIAAIIAALIYTWAGFTVWLQECESYPTARNPLDLLLSILGWWLLPILFLFEK